MKKLDNLSLVIVIVIVIFDLLVWGQIVFAKPAGNPALYFLDVGQGDGTLLSLPGDIQILTDAGPNQSAVREVEQALGSSDRYIDLAIITHPQLDHFNGFYYLLDRYEFGAFIINGRTDAAAKKELEALIGKIETKKIPIITLAAGDRIRSGDNTLDFLSPDASWIQSGELNDTSFVAMVRTTDWSALLTGDIGANVEGDLTEKYDLKADILKVPHHGSKYSSSEQFLREVEPKLAVIEVGENRYGHPTREVLSRFDAVGVKTFRTDRDGTVKMETNG
ncbi:MAG: MBL fold metallo-hydrolase, partial [Patescibacteria group bacterium]